MTAVLLARNWFAPGGTRFRKGMYDDMPDQLLEHLPSSARVSDGEKMVPVKDFLSKKGKKHVGKTEAGDFAVTDAAEAGGDPKAPDPNPESKSVPANTEGEGVSSPKSSGPETQALPGENAKTGEMVTASGSTTADKVVADATKKAQK